MKKTLCILLSLLMVSSLLACEAKIADTVGDPAVDTTATSTAQPAVESAPEPAATPDPNMVIEFNDDVLEAIIREAMGKPDGDILVSDALTVTQLELSMDGSDWSNPRIHNLDALKYFTNLTQLTIGWSVQNAAFWDRDVDISALSGMTKMEALAILCINVSDVSALAGMTQLKSLVIMGTNRLTDLTPLSKLSQLESLEIKSNAVDDLTPLEGLTNLQYLDLSGNFIQDVSPLAGLSKLTTLYLGSNPIKDYTMLAGIRPSLSGCDFEPDSAPQAINFNDSVLEQKIRAALNIPDGEITFAQTEPITELLLGNEWQESIPDDIKISDISALKYFPNLKILELQNNNISDLNVFIGLKSLKKLDLAGNPVFSIEPLQSCGSIQWLNLSGSRIENEQLAPISTMTKLDWLDLSSVPGISSIEPLAELTNLKALYLNNLAVDFSPIAGLTNLTTLYLEGPRDGLFTPDYSPLESIYPNLTDKNFEMPLD